MGLFVCETLPSENFDGEAMAIPYALVHKLSQRGKEGTVWVTYWGDGVNAKRPLQGTWEDNVAALQAAG
jgi:hypothetical protein